MTIRFPDDSIRIRRSNGALGSLRPNTNYGIGSVHNFKKEIEDTLRPAMERQTRGDMHDEPSHEAVDKEIAYRWGQEASAMRRLSDNELEMVYKTGMKPSEYLSNK